MPADPALVQALLAALEVATAEDGDSDSAVISQAATAEKLLLSFPEAGDFLGLSRSWVFRAVKIGLLPSVEIPGARGRYIRRRDLEEFVDVLGVAEADDGKSRQLRAAAGGGGVIQLGRRPGSRGSALHGSSPGRSPARRRT